MAQLPSAGKYSNTDIDVLVWFRPYEFSRSAQDMVYNCCGNDVRAKVGRVTLNTFFGEQIQRELSAR